MSFFPFGIRVLTILKRLTDSMYFLLHTKEARWIFEVYTDYSKETYGTRQLFHAKETLESASSLIHLFFRRYSSDSSFLSSTLFQTLSILSISLRGGVQDFTSSVHRFLNSIICDWHEFQIFFSKYFTDFFIFFYFIQTHSFPSIMSSQEGVKINIRIRTM